MRCILGNFTDHQDVCHAQGDTALHWSAHAALQDSDIQFESLSGFICPWEIATPKILWLWIHHANILSIFSIPFFIMLLVQLHPAVIDSWSVQYANQHTIFQNMWRNLSHFFLTFICYAVIATFVHWHMAHDNINVFDWQAIVMSHKVPNHVLWYWWSNNCTVSDYNL